MADAPYLVCLALAEQAGKRLLPLAGQSQPGATATAGTPGALAKGLALELLIRLWQRTDQGAIARVCGMESLLLLELPLEWMSAELPSLKAAWINGGPTEDLLSGLQEHMVQGWCLSMAKYEEPRFTPWPAKI
ncbi:hypothetical protein [Cyanobium sp. Morenito 9A2]|uniref:hypothetical protein n=1 Tax=Cyanobium sp. Morenito 9A2 TaxID=2823718 RepID=UPI0020CE03E0|nr:hypothetical protein [Cyanobium sp. Morenito 9A2]MCP9849234.1 hypothetical protein [Cyanobium sp. Morenito 9A2]